MQSLIEIEYKIETLKDKATGSLTPEQAAPILEEMQELMLQRNNLRQQNQYTDLFRDYFNHFLTIGRFASYYDMTERKARWILFIGRRYHNQETNR